MPRSNPTPSSEQGACGPPSVFFTSQIQSLSGFSLILIHIDLSKEIASGYILHYQEKYKKNIIFISLFNPPKICSPVTHILAHCSFSFLFLLILFSSSYSCLTLFLQIPPLPYSSLLLFSTTHYSFICPSIRQGDSCSKRLKPSIMPRSKKTVVTFCPWWTLH